jgi:predicted AAA+ superfamily ATPase
VYIKQRQLDNLGNLLEPGKAIIIFGPRRCGKTTLLNEFLKKTKLTRLFVTGEDITVQGYLNSQSVQKLTAFVGGKELLVIDEAQKIGNIGLNLKLIIDHVPEIRIIATGSSSFDLAQGVGEPLTGRKYTLRLYPLAQLELTAMENAILTESNLESRLVYGSYPEIVLMEDNLRREIYLKEIVGSYLYKDILELDGVRHSQKIGRLLQLIAFQIGKEVSLTELASQLGMSKNTVDRYLDLLEKSFVLRRLGGFSRNPRKEISKSSRYYFIDNGIRNALINNFNPLDIRNDVGMLWENYLIMERFKRQEYLMESANNYFWRTYDRKEIDLVEEAGGRLHGYEIKWRKKKELPPHAWKENYPDASFQVVHKDNYLDFIV